MAEVRSALSATERSSRNGDGEDARSLAALEHRANITRKRANEALATNKALHADIDCARTAAERLRSEHTRLTAHLDAHVAAARKLVEKIQAEQEAGDEARRQTSTLTKQMHSEWVRHRRLVDVSLSMS